MSIAQKLEINYKNQIENIKKEKNRESKIKQIGALVMDVGKRSIKAVAEAIHCSRKYVKYCFLIVKNDLQIVTNRHKCGRKKKIEEYPTLESDIQKIMEENTYTDPHFRTEKQFTKLTTKEIMNRLLDTGKYKETFISKSKLASLLNEMGYNLKKVKRNKPLKKIEETDAIFENVHNKKEEALNNIDTALISIDTKDKVLIGPFSRKGKSRILVEGCDHELTNHCIIPFGILDIKTNQSYFYNFTHKPTSLAIVDCLEDYIIQNPKYERIAILLDNGPDNSGVRTAFLKGLVDLSNKYHKEIELIYYPPYHSKYNPVERLWARLEMMWNGFLLTSEEICNQIMKKLTWKEVKAKVKCITKEYEKGITYSKAEMKQYEGINILRNKELKKWSILVTPTL